MKRRIELKSKGRHWRCPSFTNMYVCVCMYVCMYVCMCVCSIWQNRKLSRHRRSPDKWGDELKWHKRVATDSARPHNTLYDREENSVATGGAQRNAAMKWTGNKHIFGCMYVCMYVCMYCDTIENWMATGGAQRHETTNWTEVKGSPLAVPELHKYVCMRVYVCVYVCMHVCM